jgi:large subunit ribosomal protein L23
MAEKNKGKKEQAKKTAKAEKKVTKQKNIEALASYTASLNFPHTTEKSIGLIEKENTLVFIVDRRSSKTEIKQAIEKTYGVKVDAVRTSITQHNFKKAFVKLNKDSLASEVAIRLGII